MPAKQNTTTLSRKKFVSLLAGLPLVWKTSLQTKSATSMDKIFPARNEFDIKGVYLNAAYTHPMSKGSYNEVQLFLNERLMNGKIPRGYDGFDRTEALNNFAKLINASPDEIAWVPSTMVGENLIVHGLSIPGTKARVVTDALHFSGSLHMYGQLAKDGVDVVVVKPRNNEIDLNDLTEAITPGTRLVAISLVSATTGFQHDLKKVCEIAHARGALVYCDIIQAAGAVPIDVHATGVDFCACATYKWLMGDFGIGFLYVRKDVLPSLKRTVMGYRQAAEEKTHFLPYDAPGKLPFESTALTNMSGHFEVGTFANEGIVALRYSLAYLNRVGVEAIQQYRQPMIDYLQTQLAGDKFIPLTPKNSTSPIVCFAFKDAHTVLQPKIDAAGINIQVYDNRIRISPSFYNDMHDVEYLVEVLKGA